MKSTFNLKNPHPAFPFLIVVILAGVGWGIWNSLRPPPPPEPTPEFTSTPEKMQSFDGERAYQDVVTQVNYGPRTPGSTAHGQTVEFIRDELTNAGWIVDMQEATMLNHPVLNIIGKRGVGAPWVIIGAHYDSRLQADKDPDPALRGNPNPGANDGASGVGVLLELARVLPQDVKSQVWLVFFDAEDNGNIEGWDWILGSQAFVASLQGKPDAAIIIDMIGDTDLNIYQEKNSDPVLTSDIWDTARTLGYEQYFIPEVKHAVLDDHIPFVRAGITAIDIIDIEYPYWHTTQDTADKVSPQSLQIVGETLYAWLVKQGR